MFFNGGYIHHISIYINLYNIYLHTNLYIYMYIYVLNFVAPASRCLQLTVVAMTTVACLSIHASSTRDRHYSHGTEQAH